MWLQRTFIIYEQTCMHSGSPNTPVGVQRHVGAHAVEWETVVLVMLTAEPLWLQYGESQGMHLMGVGA